jgi:hypothetical protein
MWLSCTFGESADEHYLCKVSLIRKESDFPHEHIRLRSFADCGKIVDEFDLNNGTVVLDQGAIAHGSCDSRIMK